MDSSGTTELRPTRWTPLRVAAALSAVVWGALLVLSAGVGAAHIGEPPNEFYAGGSGAFLWTFTFLGLLIAAPITVIVWLVAVPVALARAWRGRRSRRRR